MCHYRYSMMTANLDCGVKSHPLKVMANLGYKWTKCEPFPIADCWIFRFDEEIKNPPPYLIRIADDFKFSGEE